MAGLMNRIVVPLSVVLALVGVWVTWSATSKYSTLMTQSQQVQQQLLNFQVRQQQLAPRVRQVLQEVAAYGQGKPALESLLAKYGLRIQPAAPATSAQPPRPATRSAVPAKGSTETGTGR